MGSVVLGVIDRLMTSSAVTQLCHMHAAMANSRLGDASKRPGGGAAAVAFEVELAVEGVVDRLDPLPQRANARVAKCLAASDARCGRLAASAPPLGKPVPRRTASSAAPGQAAPMGLHDGRSPCTVRSGGYPGLESRPINHAPLYFPSTERRTSPGSVPHQVTLPWSRTRLELLMEGAVLAPDDVPADHAGLLLVTGVVGVIEHDIPQHSELGWMRFSKELARCAGDLDIVRLRPGPDVGVFGRAQVG
jgi:hypothetical protein